MVHSLLDKLAPKHSQESQIQTSQLEETRSKLYAFQLALHSPRETNLSPRADSQGSNSGAEESSQEDEEEYDMEEEEQQDEQTGDKKKNCRVNFACTECRKAHKGCSGGRPCERCVKMGLQDKCRSSARKKRILTKKYWHHFLVQQLSKTPTVEGMVGYNFPQQPSIMVSPRQQPLQQSQQQISPRMLYSPQSGHHPMSPSNQVPFLFETVNSNAFVPYQQAQMPFSCASQQPQMPYYSPYQQQQMPQPSFASYEAYSHHPMAPSVCHTSIPPSSMNISPRGDVDQVQPMKISPRFHIPQQQQTMLPSISNLIDSIEHNTTNSHLLAPHGSNGEDSLKTSPRGYEKLSLKSILN